MTQDRDPFFDTLLNLDVQVFYMGDKGHRVQFTVVAVPPSVQRPHGLAYTLTVHNPRGERIAGFDNAHGFAATKGPGGKLMAHDHKHRFKTVRPYDYRDALALLEDFWKLVEDVLQEEGVTI
jgi:hypothetical protein